MILKTLKEFWDYYENTPEVEIYNEFSFQHELGIFLRKNMLGYKVQFERNAQFFLNNNSVKTTKHEIDIVVFNDTEKYAIELKYPRHGQVPVRMFKFIEDIQFMEELKQNGFDRTFVMAIADEKEGKGFFDSNMKYSDGIYSYFRTNGNKSIHGVVPYPCAGKLISPLNINGNYNVKWYRLPRGLYGYVLEID